MAPGRRPQCAVSPCTVSPSLSLHGDHALFDLLTLKGAQAGLSWSTIFARRDSRRRALAGFDAERIASPHGPGGHPARCRTVVAVKAQVAAAGMARRRYPQL